MRQRLDFVTIGVRDLGASRRFYMDGLGWEPTLDLPEVVFLQVGHGLLLGLWPAEDMEADVSGAAAASRAGPGSGAPFTLAHNVDSEHAVVEALEAAAASARRSPGGRRPPARSRSGRPASPGRPGRARRTGCRRP